MPVPASAAVPLHAAPIFVGVDVGGTNIKIGLVSDAGAPLAHRSIPTDQEQGAESAARRIGAALRSLMGEANVPANAVVRLGLATPGPMDIPRGLILNPGNLPAWRDSPIRDLVASAVGLPVTYANDANAAAYGEFWVGAGRQYKSLVMFTMGTGIGGGIVIGERLVEGSHSCGGELGHIVIDSADDAPLNSLGVRGSLEGYCGAYAVIRRTEEKLAHGDASRLRRRIEQGEELTPRLVAEEAEAGDELSLDIVMETARYMAIGVVSAIHTIDPESVVLGGAMTFGGAGHPLGEKFLERLRREARSRMIATLRDRVAIGFAALGGEAGFIGAAGLARREHHDQ